MALNDPTDELLKWAKSLPKPTPAKPTTKRPLVDLAKEAGFTVTSTTGGAHNPGSKHYQGKAIDVRTRDKTPSQIEEFMRRAQSSGYRVRDERSRPQGQKVWSGPHLHLEDGGEVADVDESAIWAKVNKTLGAPKIDEAAVWSKVDQVIGKAPTPTRPVQTAPINKADLVVPEAPVTLDMQLRSTVDGSSPKAAVLVNANQVNLLQPELLKALKPVQLPDGRVLFVNEQKARNLGVSDYARDFAKLIGKVEDVGDNTGQGQAVVTLGGYDEELNSSIVTSPQAAAKQAALDRSMFPNAVKQEILPAQEVVQKRYQQWLVERQMKDERASVDAFNIEQQAEAERVNDEAARNAPQTRTVRKNRQVQRQEAGSQGTVEPQGFSTRMAYSGDATRDKDEFASRISNALGLDYESTRQYINETLTTGNTSFSPDVSKKWKGQEANFKIDAGGIEIIKQMSAQAEKNKRRQETQKATAENQVREYVDSGEVESVAQLLAAKDVGVKDIKGKSIDDLITEERAAFQRFKDTLQNDPNEYNRILQTEQARLAAGESPEKIVQEIWSKQNQAKIDAVRREIAEKKLGSFVGREAEQQRILDTYGTLTDSSRPMARPTEFVLNIAREFLKVPGQAANLAGMGADAMSQYGINPQDNPMIQLGESWKGRIDSSQNKDLKDELIVGDVSKAVAQLAEQTLFIPFTGGASMLLPAAQAAESQYIETSKDPRATKGDRLGSALWGAVLSVPDAYLKFSFLKGLAPAAKRSFLDNMASNLAQGLATKMSKDEARRATIAAVGEFVAKAPVGYFGEKYQEQIEDIGNKAFAKVSVKPEMTWKDVFEASEREKQGYEAAGLVGIFGVGGGSITNYLNRVSDAELMKATPVLDEALKNGTITPAQRKEVDAAIFAEAEKRKISLKPAQVADKKGNTFTILEDQGEKLKVQDEKGNISVRNADRLKPINEKTPDVSKPAARVDEKSLVQDQADKGETAAVPVAEDKRPIRYREDMPAGLVDEAPLKPATLKGAENRIAELETEVQEERRRADTNDLTGLGSKNAWKKARPNIEANPEKAIISFDGNNIKSANDTTSHATVDKKVMARLGEVTRKVFEKHGLPIRDAFTPSGDELYTAVPPAMQEQVRDEIEKEFGVVEIVAERDYTNDRTGETFKKGDVIPVTLSGTFGQTVDEAEVGLDERKKASKAANPVRRVEAAKKEPWEMTLPQFIEKHETREMKGWVGSRAAKMMQDDGIAWEEAVDRAYQLSRGRDNRRIAVEQAIAEGKPVPAEVLADYPDLAPKKSAKQRLAEKGVADEYRNTIAVGKTVSAKVNYHKFNKEKTVSGPVVKVRKKDFAIKDENEGEFWLSFPKTAAKVGDQIEYEIPDVSTTTVQIAEKPQSPARERFEKKKAEAKVEPIRQLGTGSNVYFETDKIRVNETTSGKALLHAQDQSDDPYAMTTVSFETPEEAVKIAARLDKTYPKGYPPALLIDRVIEGWRKEGSKPATQEVYRTRLDKSQAKMARNKSVAKKMREKGYEYTVSNDVVKVTKYPDSPGQFEIDLANSEAERKASSKKGKPVANPKTQSLSTYLLRRGGIRPNSVVDLEPIKLSKLGKFFVSSNGQDVEDAFRDAVEAGYFPGLTNQRAGQYDMSIDEFVNAVADDANGFKKLYTSEAVEAIQDDIEQQEKEYWEEKEASDARLRKYESEKAAALKAATDLFEKDSQFRELLAKMEAENLFIEDYFSGEPGNDETRQLQKYFEQAGISTDHADAIISELGSRSGLESGDVAGSDTVDTANEPRPADGERQAAGQEVTRKSKHFDYDKPVFVGIYTRKAPYTGEIIEFGQIDFGQTVPAADLFDKDARGSYTPSPEMRRLGMDWSDGGGSSILKVDPSKISEAVQHLRDKGFDVKSLPVDSVEVEHSSLVEKFAKPKPEPKKPATAFDQVDLFGNKQTPKTEAQSLFEMGEGESVSPDAEIAKVQKTIDGFASRAGNEALVETANEALKVFALARKTRASVDDMLRQQNLDGTTVADELSPLATKLLKAMDAGSFDAAMATESMKAPQSEGESLKMAAGGFSLDSLYDEKGSISYERVKDVAGRVESGELEIRGLDPEGERGRIEGGRRNVEASLILAAGESAIQAASAKGRSGMDSHSETVRRQENLLENYAKREGIWFKPGHFPDRLYLGRGGEAKVYQKDESRVAKIVDYRHIDKGLTPQKFIDNRIALFNALFPESKYELMGFMRDGEGKFRFIVTQPLVQGSEIKSQQEVDDWFFARGLQRSGYDSYSNKLYQAHDLHIGNVLKTAKGNIVVIDAVPKPNYVVEPLEIVEPESLKMAAGEQTVPDTLYHGGPKGIAEFKKGQPFFLTTEASGAEWYAIEKADLGNGQIYKVTPNFKKVWDLRGKVKEDGYLDRDPMREFIDLARNAGVNVTITEYPADKWGPSSWEFYSEDIANFSGYDGGNAADLIYIPEVRKALEEKGYDGIRLYDALENGEIDTVIGWNPASVQLDSLPQTETPAFKKWFGDSKVVDADGEPLVVYHGTSDPNFEKFSHRFRGSMGGRLGFWFASNPAALESFTRSRYADAGPAVIPSFLSIQNPVEFATWTDFVDRINAEKGGTLEKRMEAFRRAAIRRSFDGIVIRDSDTDGGVVRDDWVAFQPNQIKSAIGNRGTFDPNEDSILKMQANDSSLERFKDYAYAHTQTVLEDATSEIKEVDGQAVLELNEAGAELARRVEASATGKKVGQFYGSTHTTGQLKNLAQTAKEWADRYEEKGYTADQVKSMRDLAANLETLAEKGGAGVVYIFDFALPHETHHKLVLDALGGKAFPKKALAELEALDIWNANPTITTPDGKSKSFNSAYPRLSKANKAIEMAAMLETGEISHSDKAKFLDIFARGILDVTTELDPVAFARILDYANTQASDTRGDRTEQTDGEPDERSDGTASAESERDGERVDDPRAGERAGGRTADDSRPRNEKERKVASFSRILGQEYFYDQQSHDETEVRAAQLLSDKGTQQAIYDALYGTPSAEGMRVVYWELERLAGALDNAIAEDNKAEIAAYSEAAADLSAKIVQRQVAGGQEIEIAKMLVPLSPEAALLAAQKMVEYAKGEGSTLTPGQTETVIRLAQELKDARADIAQADKKVKTLEKKIDKLKEERPTTRTARMLKQYRKRKPALVKELQDLFPEASVFNGETYSLQMVAWHGSPHRFEKFDISKIGTGEGNQAYGYGLYFAGAEDVADHYKTALQNTSHHYYIDGKEINYTDLRRQSGAKSDALLSLARPKEYGKIIETLNNSDAPDAYIEEVKKYRNELDGRVEFKTIQTGAKYKVQLKPDEDEYLLWDRPLSEQSKIVQRGINDLIEEYHGADILEPGDMLDGSWEVDDAGDGTFIVIDPSAPRSSQTIMGGFESEADAEEFIELNHPQQTGGDFYNHLENVIGIEPQQISSDLRGFGVRGIKFLDGSSRSKGEGNYNYVIFDDADVEIVESFQMAAPADLTDQQRAKLIEYATGEVLENKPYKTLISELNEFTGDETVSKDIHAEAIAEMRSERGEMSQEAKDALKTRNEHYREADKILRPKGENQNVKKQIDKDFKKLNDQNVKELSRIARRVWAKTGDPLMTLAVERLNTDPKTINEVIKDIQRANPEMSLSDATKFARDARQMLTETKAEMAAERDKLKGILPEQRKELQAAKVAKQKATMKLNKFLANLADDSNAVKRFNNDMRAKFVSNWGTQAFNAIQSLTVTNPTEAMLDLYTVALKSIGLNIGETPDINAKDILLPFSYVFANNRQMAEFALAEFPDQFFQVHTGLLGDIDIEPVNLADNKKGISKGIHKWFDLNQRVNNKLAQITGAKLQEMHFRNAMVAGTFDQIIRRKSDGKVTLEKAIEDGTVKDYITEEDAQYAANKAMRVTFAAQIDDKFGKVMKRAYDKLDSFVPIFLNPVTYARFTYTATKVMVANPILFGALDAKALGGPGYDTKSMASGLLGWTGIAMAYGLMANFGGDDDEWYTLKFGDTWFDVRRTFPLSTYFYMAHLIKNFKDGKPAPTPKELAEGFASLETDYFTYGAGVEMLSTVGGKLGGTKEWSDVGASGARLAGNFFAGYLRFFKPMRDALAQFDEEENKLRFYNNSGADKFVQEISKSLPLVARSYGAEVQKDATGQDIMMPFPAGRIVGINVVHPSFLKPEQSTATKWATKLFRFEGAGGEMSADDRRAWQMRRTIKNAVRRGTPADQVQGQLQAYRKRFGERSFDRLKDEMKLSELATAVKYNFGMTDEKDIRSLRKLWQYATDAEKAELRKVLRAKRNRTAEFNREFGLSGQ